MTLRRHWRRSALALLALAVVAGVASLGARAAGDGDLRRARVERRDLAITVDVEGVLRAVDTVGVGPPAVPYLWNYKISFLAPEGSEVAAGEPVVGFDPTDLQRRLQEAGGARESAAKRLEKRTAELDLERRDLALELAEAEARQRRFALALAVPPEVASRRELEKARIDHDLAAYEVAGLGEALGHLAARTRAELAALAAERDRATRRERDLEAHLRSMTVAAPRAGTVVYDDQREEKLKVGDTVWRAETVVEIPDLARMKATGEVDEGDVGRLVVGQPVRLVLDAHPDDPVAGRVRAIDRTVRRRLPGEPRKVVDVEIALDATDPERMRPGMRFRGTIEVDRAADVLTVPLAAVVPGPAGPAVEVAAGLGTRTVVPDLGRRDGERVEVVGGLEEGDEVVVGGGGS